jgi:hypothetical protein
MSVPSAASRGGHALVTPHMADLIAKGRRPPIAPTYPGAYIQEFPGGVRTLVGVSPSTALFMGAVKLFFLNGGTTYYVMRITDGEKRAH